MCRQQVLREKVFFSLHKHSVLLSRDDTDIYLRRGGYQGPPIDELLAGGEVGLIVWLAARR